MTSNRRTYSLHSLRAAVALIACCLLASCAGMVGPRQIEVSQDRLQQSLDRRFPMHHRVLAVFDVELSHPQLAIEGDNDRVALTLDATVAPLLARQQWHGSMAISGRLVVDRARNAVYISDAHVDRFVFDGMDEGRQQQLASVANLLSEKTLKDMAVYTFKPEDLRYAGMQFMLTNISTRPGALVATVAPAQ